MTTTERLREDALTLYRQGIKAVDPRTAVHRCVQREGEQLRFGDGEAAAIVDLAACESVCVVGAGKASGAMAAALEELLGDRLTRGVVAVPHGTPNLTKRIRLMPAAHPVPDEAGLIAAREIAGLAAAAGKNDLLIAIFSGGGSALLPAPAGAIALGEKQRVTRLLLRSGADIGEVNTIRKHLSFLKGGRLARLAAPARVASLLISDVIGDDPGTIASGPTAPDPTTAADALRIVQSRGLDRELPPAVRAFLHHHDAETPKPGDPLFDDVRNFIVARNADALDAIARMAETMGYTPVVFAGNVQGEAREAAAAHIMRCREIARTHRAGPLCCVSGGETTVTVHGSGKGGRNQEFALAAAMAMKGWNGAVLLSAGTDGIDGSTTAAGAFADGRTIDRGRSLGFDPEVFLRENDSNSFFFGLNDILVIGATGTNVMDVQILVCE